MFTSFKKHFTFQVNEAAMARALIVMKELKKATRIIIVLVYQQDLRNILIIATDLGILNGSLNFNTRLPIN